MDGRLRSTHTVTYVGTFHVVFCPKYRRKVLMPPVVARLKEIVREQCAVLRQDLLAVEIQPDHVHVLVGCDPQFGIHRLVKHLKGVLAGIGALKVRRSRPIQGTIKTVTIHRSADQWYVCFSCMLEMPQPVPPDRPATALDVGLEYFATLADGSHVDNPRYLREAEEVLARRQRTLQTKKRGSKNRRRAKVLVARAHRRIRNKRSNFHHQEARTIVDRHGAIAIEGLRIKNMVRNPCLAKSISDAGWNQFLTILTRKAEEAGVVVVIVNPAGTSQVCSGCGRTVPKALSDRWHTCPYEDCGLSLQRDHNSARTILNRARVPACGSPVLGSDPQQHPLPSGMGSVKLKACAWTLSWAIELATLRGER